MCRVASKTYPWLPLAGAVEQLQFYCGSVVEADRRSALHGKSRCSGRCSQQGMLVYLNCANLLCWQDKQLRPLQLLDRALIQALLRVMQQGANGLLVTTAFVSILLVAITSHPLC